MLEIIKNHIKAVYLKYKYRVLIKNNCSISLDSKFGNNVVLEKNITLSHSIIGKSVYIGNDSKLFYVSIGNYSSIGPRVTIGENEHIIEYITTCNYLLPKYVQRKYDELNKKKTIIENDVWVGAGAYLKKGVVIGNGAVVAAHAVVTKDVPPYAVVAGVPAKIIKYRFKEKYIDLLLAEKWWEGDENKIKENLSDLYGKYQYHDKTINKN